MIIFPAIDLKEGKCVRLYKGDFNKTTIFNKSPLHQMKKFEKMGFKYLHLVDLDGALNGKSKNKKIILKILKNRNLNIQLGGGIRTLKQISFWIKNGVSKVILGTTAIKNPKILVKACNLYPKKIAVALDIRGKTVATNGWVNNSNIKFEKLINNLKKLDICYFIITDINRDGTKLGINLSKLKKILKKTNIPLVASGGVGNVLDIIKLKKIKNIVGVIIGRALYEKKIKVTDLKKNYLL
jgi:phosphoribosylformimino-5-aminoimidazole carboxamide ribotide isomerase